MGNPLGPRARGNERVRPAHTPPTPKAPMHWGQPVQIKRAEKHPRNEPCHCGSGKKFKRCCIDEARA